MKYNNANYYLKIFFAANACFDTPFNTFRMSMINIYSLPDYIKLIFINVDDNKYFVT